jgi:hypothetical protein
MTATTFNYRLRPYVSGVPKMPCPACGRKSFTPYIGEGGSIISPTCGRCDHTASCGYHISPSTYFSAHPETRIQIHQAPAPIPEPDSITFGDAGKVWDASHLAAGETSDFANGLRRYFTPEQVRQACKDYHLRAWGRFSNVAFPSINERGELCDVMVIGYGSDLHRNDICFRPRGCETWKATQRRLHPNGYKLRSCLFGLHLITQRPAAQVCIVEAQKTAIIASLIFPSIVWLATGGCENFKSSILAPLEGRVVTAIPDSGCEEKWGAVCRASKIDIRLAPAMLNFPEYGENADIADVILAKIAKNEPISELNLFL